MIIKDSIRFFMDPSHRSTYKDWEALISARITDDPDLIQRLISANRLWSDYDLETTKDFLDQSFRCYAVEWTPASTISQATMYFKQMYRRQVNTQKLSELAYIRQLLDPQRLEMLEFSESSYRPQFALVDRSRPEMNLKTELTYFG